MPYSVRHTGLPCFLTPYDFTSSLRFDGEILSTLFLCCCLCVRKRNGSYKCVRLSVGFLLPISLSVILCGWLKGISNENLYRILRSVVPCAVSLRLPFNRSRLWVYKSFVLSRAFCISLTCARSISSRRSIILDATLRKHRASLFVHPHTRAS